MENRSVIVKYSEHNYLPTPTNFTFFWCKFIPFQILRFIILTLKIIKIVVKGHS